MINSEKIIYNPSRVLQFMAFNETIDTILFENLFNNTLKILAGNLDIELFLYIYKSFNDKKNSLLSIFNSFPNFKIENNISNEDDYSKILLEDSSYKNINFLQSIYFTIIDFPEAEKYCKNNINNFLDNIIKYNQRNSDYPIYIKENMFKTFINETKDDNEINNICKYCENISSLFQYLENYKGTNNLIKITKEGIPQICSENDDIVGLIKKMEKIKTVFEKDCINIIWTKYLELYKRGNNYEKLEEIKTTLLEVEPQFYSTLIEKIKNEICIKMKNMIISGDLKGQEMLKFINKYHKEKDFFKDSRLIKCIAKNISLEEIDTNKTMLEDYKKGNYLEEIWEIEQFLEGFFEQIHDLYFFSLYLKYIVNIDKIQDVDLNNIKKIVEKTIDKFYNLLNNANSKNQNKEIISEIYRKIILMHFIFIYDESTQNGDEFFKKIVKNSISIYQEKEIFEIIITNVINNQSNKEKIGDIKFNSMIDSVLNVLYEKISSIKDKILCFKMIQDSEANKKGIELFPKNMMIFLMKMNLKF